MDTGFDSKLNYATYKSQFNFQQSSDRWNIQKTRNHFL